MKYINVFLFIIVSNFTFAQIVIKDQLGEVKSSIDIFEENKVVDRQELNLTINSGSSNLINLRQVGVNHTNAYIRGNFNEMFIVQNGLENSTEVVQDGNRNYLSSYNRSTGTRVANIQIGNNNFIDQNLIDADFSDFILIQNGSGLSINHSVEGIQLSGLEVRMTGRDMGITIETKQ